MNLLLETPSPAEEDDVIKAKREKSRIYMAEYRKTAKGLKKNRIQNWKTKGIIGDYDEIYERYLSIDNCEGCGVLMNQEDDKGTIKVLDHCHKTGIPRMVCCLRCNVCQLDRHLSTTNNSGHRGICYIKRSHRWCYTKSYRGKDIFVRCKSKTNCLAYKFAVILLIRSGRYKTNSKRLSLTV
tara:strand:- start:781 stop:1326 length:546 start_codon:yes stop_codon:yes gene_type:complete